MVASLHPFSTQPDVSTLHAGFLALLPRIERHGRFCFRKVNCPQKKADCLAEMTALAWQWYRSLALRGKDGATFPSALASYAGKAVRSGRRLCGQEKTKDVMSLLAQRSRGFATTAIPNGSSINGHILEDALRDNTRSGVPEQAAFRLDFPAWMQTYDVRKRRVIEDLMSGERTLEVAKKLRLSPAAISQMRRRFNEDWVRFCAPPVERRRIAAN